MAIAIQPDQTSDEERRRLEAKLGIGLTPGTEVTTEFVHSKSSLNPLTNSNWIVPARSISSSLMGEVALFSCLNRPITRMIPSTGVQAGKRRRSPWVYSSP